MADPVFSPPWAESGQRREPTAAERSTGYVCGPADLELFNGRQNVLERELKAIIDRAATTNDSATNDNVLRAIIQIIAEKVPDAADTGSFRSAEQLKATLPFFPEITSGGGVLSVTSPADGTVRLSGGGTFVHRGVEAITTTETDFATTASKTYHLRWRPATGYGLFDLADGTYNAGTLAEDATAFDSTFDDMLIARVVTSGANVANVTALTNLNHLGYRDHQPGVNPRNPGLNEAAFDFNFTWNWARTPKDASFVPTRISNVGEARDKDRLIYDKGDFKGTLRGQPTVSRYGSYFIWMEDYARYLNIAASVSA